MSVTRHLTRGRDLARTAGDHAADMFAPLTVIGRGLRHHADWAKARWAALRPSCSSGLCSFSVNVPASQDSSASSS